MKAREQRCSQRCSETWTSRPECPRNCPTVSGPLLVSTWWWLHCGVWSGSWEPGPCRTEAGLYFKRASRWFRSCSFLTGTMCRQQFLNIIVPGRLQHAPWAAECVWTLSCVWLFSDAMDCSPPGSSVHGISWARIPECFSYSRGCSRPRDRICVSCTILLLYHHVEAVQRRGCVVICLWVLMGNPVQTLPFTVGQSHLGWTAVSGSEGWMRTLPHHWQQDRHPNSQSLTHSVFCILSWWAPILGKHTVFQGWFFSHITFKPVPAFLRALTFWRSGITNCHGTQLPHLKVRLSEKWGFQYNPCNLDRGAWRVTV